MLIEAVVEKGQVRFLHPDKFLHDYFSVKIEIPDQEFAAEVPNGHGNVTTPDNETCHARSLTPVPPLPKGEGYSSSLREFHVNKRNHVEAEILPPEYLAFKALQVAAFGSQYHYEAEKTDREIMQEHWVSKHA